MDQTNTYTGDMSEAMTSADLPPISTAQPKTLTVDKANKIIRAFTDDPSWLADPRTSHAANSVFAAAAKVVGMNMQMERLTNASAAEKVKNEFTKQKVDALAKLSPLVPEDDELGQSELGRLNSMVGSPDFNLQEFSAGVSRLQSKYKAPTPLSLIEARDKAVQKHIEMRAETQGGLAEKRFQNQKELMRQKELWGSLATEEKTILGRYQKDYDSATRMIENLQKAGVTEDDPRMVAANIKRGLVAERQTKFLEAVRPEMTTTAPTATQPSASVKRVRVTGPNGEKGTVVEGESLPQGWSFE